jgi:hypothetical protein
MSKRIVVGWIIPLILAALLYYFMIKPNAFNLLPYLIHENYFSDGINETTFIRVFDAFVAIIVGLVLRVIFLRRFVPTRI